MLKLVNVCVLIQFIMRDISQTSHVGGGVGRSSLWLDDKASLTAS